MTIDQFNFAGKKTFVRVDFNVPVDENFNITDDTRIVAAMPTLKKIIADGGRLIIASHMGRHSSDDTGIIGDVEVLINRNVEVNAYESLLSCKVEFVNCHNICYLVVIVISLCSEKTWSRAAGPE